MVLLLVGGLLIALLVFFQPLHLLQRQLSDSLFQADENTPGIVLAQIDDHSLETHGRFGDWPRTLHAEAVANLDAAGARVIVFDLLFVEASPEDDELAKSFEAANSVVLAVAGVQPLGNNDDQRYTYQTVLLPADLLRSAAVQLGHVNFPPDSDGVLRRVPVVVSDSEGQTYPALSIAAIFAQTERAVPDALVEEEGNIRILN